jgi:nucleoside-diphosphate-sugar epimerase
VKLAITGASGRIGTYVYRAALAAGHSAFGVDIAPPRDGDQVRINADLTDFGATVDALAGSDAVVHLGAIPDSRIVSRAKTYTSNMASTFNVYEAARVLGIKRVVFASSIQALCTSNPVSPSVYHYFPIDEAHELDPQSDYALSKAQGEGIGAMYARHYGISAVSLRFMWVSMPEDLEKMPFALDPDNPALAEWQREMHPANMAMLAYCDVRDTARACVLAAAADLPPGSHTIAYITASDTWADLPTREILTRFFPEAENRGIGDGHPGLISGETARRVFGFTPEFQARRQVVRKT